MTSCTIQLVHQYHLLFLCLWLLLALALYKWIIITLNVRRNNDIFLLYHLKQFIRKCYLRLYSFQVIFLVESILKTLFIFNYFITGLFKGRSFIGFSANYFDSFLLESSGFIFSWNFFILCWFRLNLWLV